MPKKRMSSKISFITFLLFFLVFSLLGVDIYFIRENKTKVYADSQTNSVINCEEYYLTSSSSKNASEEYTFENDKDLINSVEYYDNLFDGKTTQDILENHTLQLMQRKFVDTIGYDKLEREFLAGEDKQDCKKCLIGYLTIAEP